MASGQLSAVLHHLRRLDAPAEASDAELLRRFAADHDEAAFAQLVRRHGPMVLGACRRVLGNSHDAEDAFQATFLILVRKAASVRSGTALGAWLHEVALRTALRARADAAARRRREQRVPDMKTTDFIAAVVWRDLQPVLDEEVQRLPEKVRAAFVLCYLAGSTYEDAARQLRCRPGTISRRLAQARDLLRGRLTRRGLALPAGVLTAALAECATPPSVAAPLVSTTLKVALKSAAGKAAAAGGVSARVAALAEGGLRAMTTTKTKTAMIALLTLGALCGAGVLSHQALAGRQDQAAPAPAGEIKPPAPVPIEPQKGDPKKGLQSEEGETVVTGRVVGPEGKPAPGAAVAVLARRKPANRVGMSLSFPEALGQGKADGEGRFGLKVTRLTADRFWEATVLARAEGAAPGIDVIHLDRPPAPVEVRLSKEVALRGRVLDVQGQPAAGVTVRVQGFAPGPIAYPPELTTFEQAPRDMAAWPPAVVTAADGRFTLRGLAASGSVKLVAEDDRLAREPLVLNPSQREVDLMKQREEMGAPQAHTRASPKPGAAEDFIWTVPQARAFEGRVVCEDTGKPAAGAAVLLYASRKYGSMVPDDRTSGTTDAEGKFRIVPRDGDIFSFVVRPPAATPYLMLRREFKWTAGAALKQTVELKLPRGVEVRGAVAEAGTGKPLAGAGVEFFPKEIDNKFFRRDAFGLIAELKQLATTDAEGKFSLVTLPGPGHLLVSAPSAEFLTAETSARALSHGKPGGQRMRAAALLAVEHAPGSSPQVKASLRRGVTATGTLVAPGGAAPKSAVAFYDSFVYHSYGGEMMQPQEIKGGKFELPGLDPERAEKVYFVAAQEQLAAVVTLPAKGGGPAEVKLERCGSATVRFVDEKGQPRRDCKPYPEVVVTPGADPWAAMAKGELGGKVVWQMNLDGARYHNMRPDADGRFTLPTLIPGATIRMMVGTEDRGIIPVPVSFTVEPGQTRDLGDVVVPAAKAGGEE